MLAFAVAAIALVLVASGAILFWAAYRIVRKLTGGGRKSAEAPLAAAHGS